jgi:hypothetical protein
MTVRTGPIQPEPRSREVDRSAVALTLWEQAAGAKIDLPWQSASSLTAGHLASLLATASTAVVVAGSHPSSTTLIEHTLASAPASCRIYLYGSRAIEKDAGLRKKLGGLAQRVLPRLGFDSPADWIVLDGGRTGLLLLGPDGAERRWLVPVDGPIARSLFEAFRVLFWFHATREGLPDRAGTFTFGSPLSAPSPDPGKNVALPAGRLLIDGVLQSPIPDAEICITPSGAPPGKAGVIFLPPDLRDFSVARRLSASMSRVVWADTGLPRTSVSKERFILDLVESPVALQLEWPQREAIDMVHRLTRIAQKPAWQFHASRKLGEVVGSVLLEGTAGPAPIESAVVVTVPEIIAGLRAFDSAEPAGLPAAPVLARRVMYRWNVGPPLLPAGAREAEIVRSWKAVDEWALRRVDVLRQSLASLEREERGTLDRLRQWWSGHDVIQGKRKRILEQLTELGETTPSKFVVRAPALVRGLGEAGDDVRRLVESARGAREQAEEKAAEAEQRPIWQLRIDEAAAQLRENRAKLGALESEEATSSAEIALAEAAQKAAVERLREERRNRLAAQRETLRAELDAARTALNDAPRDQRKAPSQQVQELERRLAQVDREIAAAASWTPEPRDTAGEQARLQQARAAREAARRTATTLAKESRALEQRASEPFTFKTPKHLAPPPFPDLDSAPALPVEAPPELGELFEHQKGRYLAVRTWEQVERAFPVAARLGAELVTFTLKPA